MEEVFVGHDWLMGWLVGYLRRGIRGGGLRDLEMWWRRSFDI